MNWIGSCFFVLVFLFYLNKTTPSILWCESYLSCCCEWIHEMNHSAFLASILISATNIGNGVFLVSVIVTSK